MAGLLRPPQHIQQALDREFPGLRLEWHPMLQWWVLTDYSYWPEGRRAWNVYYKTSNLLRGIEPFEFSNRKPIMWVGVIEEGVKRPLSLFELLETLRKHYHGACPAKLVENYNDFEQREETAERKAKASQHDQSRQRAIEAWGAANRSMFGSFVRRTPWSHGKAVDEEYRRRELERLGEMGDIADEEVGRRMRAGVGISAVRRSDPRVAV